MTDKKGLLDAELQRARDLVQDPRMLEGFRRMSDDLARDPGFVAEMHARLARIPTSTREDH